MRSAWPRLRGVSIAASLFFLAVAGSAVPLDPSGDLDTSFHADGRASLNFAQVLSFAEARGAAVQSNGKIVVGGNSVEGGSVLNFAAIRLNANGTRDTSFGAGGTTKIPVGTNSLLNATTVYPNDGNPATIHDDKVVLAGFANMGSNDDFVIARLTADGDLDSTFGGGDGVVTVDFGGVTGNLDRANAVAVQDDGKIVAAGIRRDTSARGDDFALVRLNVDGTLDSTFGTGGRVITPIDAGTGREQAFAVEIVGTGATRKIIAAGDTRPQGGLISTMAMARYNNNGTLDSSFGTGGISVIDLPGNTCGPNVGCGGDTLRDIAVQADGKIVGTGNFGTYGQFPSTAANLKSNMVTVRFTTTGALDTSFAAPAGFVVTTVARGYYTDIGLSAAIATDGKIVTFGWTDESTDDNATGQYPGGFKADHDFLFARFNSDGTRDATFVSNTGVPGVIRLEMGFDGATFDDGDTVILDPSNRIIGIGARTYQDTNISDRFMGIARLTTTGAVDTTFGEDKDANGTPDGFYYTQILGGSQDEAYAMAVQPADGKVVLGGWTDTGVTADFAVARFLANGDPDTGFGGGDGVATRDNAGRQDTGRALVLQADGKILLAGDSYGGAGAPTMTVMRFNANGTNDNTFGGGVVTTTFGTNGNTPNAIAIDLSGRILVGGSVSDSPGNWDFGLARFTAAGALDVAFDGDGKVRLDVGTGQNFDSIDAIVVQPDGKILVGGTTNSSSQSQFVVARFNDNGSIDTTFNSPSGRHVTRVSSASVPFAGDFVHGIVLLPDGKIVLAGKALDPTGPLGQDGNPQSFNAFALARFNPNGTLDTTFDGDGKKTLNLLQYEMGEIFSIARQVDDKIVAFGNSQSLVTGAADMALMRFNWDDGSLDTTFATAGSILTDVAGFDRGLAVAVQAGGKIVGGGTRGGNDFMALRFLGDPLPKVPGALDLDAASDSVSPLTVPAGTNTDNLTNDNTPTFTGTCETGETVILRVGGSDTAPLSRFLCRNGAYAVTAAAAIADGARSFTAISRNGAGDSTATSAIAVTIDTVALPPTVSTPAAGSTINPKPTIIGAGAEPGAFVAVTNQAGNGAVCSTNADNGGSWSCATTLGPGSYTILIRQTDRAGNTNTNNPTSRSFTIKAPTTTTIGSQPATQSVFGQQVSIGVTVDAGEYNPVTGPVNFLVDSVAAGSPTLVNGAAVILRSNLAVGNHTFAATYPESALFFGSGPSSKSFTVVKADTTTSITVTPEPSVVGQAVTINYTIAPVAPGAGTPTGTVTVGDGTLQCTGAAPTGSCTITYTSPGVRTLNASYPGDGNFNPSATTAGTPHTVNKAATTTTITADTPDPSVVAELVTVNFTVAVTAPGAGVPTGNVLVSDGVDSCSAAVSPAGTGSCSVALNTMGARTLVATYEGDGNFLGSPSVGTPHEVQNRPPVLNDQTLTALPENSPAATVVGLVAATDPDAGQSITFSITGGNTGNAFAIDPATGQVTVLTPAAINFEATPSFALTVQATDNGSPIKSDTGIVTIALVDVNEAPVIAAQARGPVAENTAAGTLVGAVVTASDPDAGQALTYAITAGNTGSAFAIHPSTGQITVAGALDFETTASYALTVSVTDNAGTPLSSSATVTVGVSDVNEAPVVNDQGFPLAENPANGAVVGTVAATEVDAGQTLTYAITAGNGLGAFALNPTTGALTVANASVVDFEVNPSFALTVRVTDNGTGALSDTATVTVTVTNANDAPVLADVTLGTLAENSAAGTVAGTVTGTDQDGGQTLTYSITAGNTGGAFAINPTSGQITVADAAALDFDTTPTFALTVTATDNGIAASSDTATVTIPLSNVNEAPVAADQTFGVAEGAANGSTVATVVATDPDAGTTLTYAITAGNTAGAFAIDPASGLLTVAAAIDFEATPQYILTVEVTDNAGTPLKDTATVTINVTNVNESPVIAAQSRGPVNENTANGTLVGAPVAASDPDAGQTLAYAITAGNTGGAFAISATTGQISVASSAALVAANSPFSLTVQVTDNGSPTPLSASATVTIVLTPTSLAISSVTAVEGNSGTTSFDFVVTLTGGGTQTVTVDFATADGSAAAPGDYTSRTGTLTFAPGGPAQQTVSVLVNGDVLHEPVETFTVTLTNPVNGGIATAVGTGTITNDEAHPTLSVADLSVREGRTGTTNADFTVSLSGPSSASITVDYATADGTALAGSDYNAVSTQTLTFAAGETTKTVTVQVIGDVKGEGHETFQLNLTNGLNLSTNGVVTITDAQALGTILDDEGSSDFNGDGKSDLLWRHYGNGSNALWFMDGATRASSMLLPGTGDTAWRMVGHGDFNGDGKPDIVWRHYGNGSNVIWFMDGSTKVGSFTLPGTGDVAWHIVGVADFNGDNKADLLWRHMTSGNNLVWFMDGTIKTGFAFLPGTGDTTWKVAGAADFTGDGKADILWRHYDSGNNYVWTMDGVTKTGGVFLPGTGDLNWLITDVADYDGDGFTDIAWRHAVTGENVIWFMNGTTRLGKGFPPAVLDLGWRMAPSDF